ncbi:hypothetical protein ILYODFUR_018222 [Ilyodon furcidens]|uniref:Uncharacterized protein n=1 Tax=Ilyodon furcidens TaxID=33524 RepID=A0ABV0VEZ5_9TELE
MVCTCLGSSLISLFSPCMQLDFRSVVWISSLCFLKVFQGFFNMLFHLFSVGTDCDTELCRILLQNGKRGGHKQEWNFLQQINVMSKLCPCDIEQNPTKVTQDLRNP